MKMQEANFNSYLKSAILFFAISGILFGSGFYNYNAFADDDGDSGVGSNIKNGSFEQPQVKDKKNWDLFPTSSKLKWTVEWADDSCSGTPTLEIQRGILGGASHKKQHAELDGECSTKIYQDIKTKLGQKYQLTYSSKARPGTDSSNNGLQVSINGDIINTIQPMSSDWEKSTHEFKGTGLTMRISFEDIGTPADGLGTFLDDVSLKKVKGGFDDDDGLDDKNQKNIIAKIVNILRGIMSGSIEFVHWDSIKDETIPEGLEDGDDDTLAELVCDEGQIAKFVSGMWICEEDGGGGSGSGDITAVNPGNGLDPLSGGDEGDVTLALLSCPNEGDILKQIAGIWTCSPDTGIDTLGALICSPGQVAKLDSSNVWQCDDDIDTDTDTLSTLACQADEVAFFDGLTWQCKGDIATFDAINNIIQCPDSSGCVDGSVIRPESIIPLHFAPNTFSLESHIEHVGESEGGEFEVTEFVIPVGASGLVELPTSCINGGVITDFDIIALSGNDFFVGNIFTSSGGDVVNKGLINFADGIAVEVFNPDDVSSIDVAVTLVCTEIVLSP